MVRTSSSLDFEGDNAFELVNWKTDLTKLFQIKTYQLIDIKPV